MDVLKLQTFFLCIFISSALEFVTKMDHDDEVKKIYEMLEDLRNELEITRKENNILNKKVRNLQMENKNFHKTIVSLEQKCQEVQLESNELRKSETEAKSSKTAYKDIYSRIDNNQNDARFQGYSFSARPKNISDFTPNMEANHKGDMDKSNSHEKVRRLLTNDISPSPSVTVNQKSIGFLAFNPNNQQNLGIHQTVEFPTALTNIGSAYNPSSSIFRAPVDGLYFFSVTILSFPGEDMETEIVHNGNGMAYTYSGSETMYGSGSTSAVLQLHANDDVWIRILNVKSVNNGNIRVHADKWSSFCGFKIA